MVPFAENLCDLLGGLVYVCMYSEGQLALVLCGVPVGRQ